MKKNQSKMIVMIVLILIVINILFFGIGYYSFNHPKLGKFEILGLVEEQSDLILNVSPCHNAISYQTKIYKDQELIYETTSESEKIVLTNFEADYEEQLKIQVVAQNKNQEEQISEKEYIYTNEDASFQKNESYLLTDHHDISLTILGYKKEEQYQVELYYGQNKLYESKVTEENITIPYHVIEGYSGRIIAYLKKENGRIISSFPFYLNTPVVGKLTITSPQNNFETRWDQVVLTYKGGENANHFFVNFYEEGSFQNRVEFFPEENQIIIPATYFNESKNYHLVLEAVYEDYLEIAEKSEVDIHIKNKEQTNAVYVSHNPNHIKSGTMVTLKTITEDAKIYYTTDGSNPSSDAILYTHPITINENTVIKTIAISRNRSDSIINTYSFQISDQAPVIYLSPSNQDENYGVQSTGFTTEMAMMNKIADVIERELHTAGIQVWRNNPKGDINAWSSKSRQVKADFHFAIHSNASSHHTARGPEIYIDKETSPAFSIASNIYENLWTIYDGNTNYDYHRGIKYANGSLGEANDNYLPCSSLIEIAYHDEEHDAAWITNNIEKIGQNLARTIISYYN